MNYKFTKKLPYGSARLLRIMKISSFLMLVTFMNVSANTFSQSISLDIQVSHENIKTLFQEISLQSDYEFLYRADLFSHLPDVQVKVKKATIKEVLDIVLVKNGFAYEIEDKTVIITKSFNQGISANQILTTIKGKVTDWATGEPIVGANIIIQGTTNGTASGVNGEFSLEADIGSILEISFVGYESKEIKASGNYMAILLIPSIQVLMDVAVIGSFSNRSRTNVERPVPVDVLSRKDLEATGQTELGQMIHFQAPSFHSTKYGIVNVTSYVDPATLRGMGTDQTLVLINGKRRHQSAALNVNRVVGKGQVGTDLNAIPTAAVKRVEILRDGAAAQYGSDAIAGIVNIVLKDDNSGGSIQTTAGISSRGDGELYEANVNYGAKINNKEGSFVNTTIALRYSGETDRKDTYSGYVYDRADPVNDELLIAQNGFDRDEDIGTKFGQSRVKSATLFINSAYPISKNWEAYTLAGLSYRDLLSFGFFRQPGRTDRRVLSLYPDGYSPLFPATSTDFQTTFGVRKTGLDDWNIDIGGSYGKNWLATYVADGPNASYQEFAPTEYYVGNNNFGQQNVGITFSKTSFNGDKAFTRAFGAQLRREEYQITVGDRVGYTVGPFGDQYEFSSTGKIAFSPREAVDKDRTNFGLFGDLEVDVTDKLLIAAATRFENYSDFGGNVSGKISSRYKLTENFSVRGSVNRGFRAPSLHQVNFSANDPQFDAGDVVNVLHLRQDDPLVTKLGYGKLKAETSLDFNIGLTAQFGGKLLLTIDAYQVKIKDRVIISENLNVNDVGLAAEPEVISGGIGEIQFFTNAVDTKTQGVDLVLTYKEKLGKGTLTGSLAATMNQTEFDSEVRTSSELAGFGVEVLDQRTKGLIEVAQPRSKYIASLGYSTSKFSVTVRATRFGEIQDVDSTDGDGKFQVKAPKILTDLVLGYNITPKIRWTGSVTNIFDVFPDRNEFGGTFDGLSPYGRSTSQFGLMGRFFSTSLSFEF
jgi:iron complex outermembrane recepter protein